MPELWTWREYFEEAVDEAGRSYVVSHLSSTRYVKRLARGEIRLIEHDPDERILTASARGKQLLADRCIQRGSDRVRNPEGGEDGELHVLSNAADNRDAVLMINWSCRP